jgi:hypothetical protein
MRGRLSFEEVILVDSNSNEREIEIPFAEESSCNGKYVFSGLVEYYPWSKNWVCIVPDDRLDYMKINGADVAIDDLTESERSNWKAGVQFNLGEHLKYGRNAIQIGVTNFGGPYGLRIDNSNKYGKEHICISLLLYVIVLIIFYLVLSHFQWLSTKTILLSFMLLSGTIGLTFFVYGNFWVFKRVLLQDATGVVKNVDLPFVEASSANNKEMIFIAIVNYNHWKSNWIHVVPDDCVECITVNGQNVSLEDIDPAKLRDWRNGFDINLGKYFTTGKNIIKIKVSDHGGDAGLKITGVYSLKDLKRTTYSFLLALPFLVFACVLLRSLGFSRGLLWILLNGFILKFVYFLGTNFTQRSYDVFGHIEYIEYIVNNSSLPPRGMGWETHQPPIYYLLAAIFYHIVSFAGTLPKEFVYRALQLFSLAAFLVYEVVCVLIFNMLLERPQINGQKEYFPLLGNDKSNRCFGSKGTPELLLVTSIFVFWPSNIINSVRINNDIFLYLFYALSLFFLVSWERMRKDACFYKAVVFAILAVMTKTNGATAIALLGIAFIVYWLWDAQKKWIKLKKTFIFILLASIGCIVTFGPGIAEKIRIPNTLLLVRNANKLYPNAFVGNTIKNYVSFDLKTFVTKPFITEFDDRLGRQYVWNVLGKTALFGMFDYEGKWAKKLGILMSINFLLMLIYCSIGMVLMMVRKNLRTWYLILASAALLLSSLLFLRFKIPAACHNDFRFIVPILVSVCLFYGAAFYAFRKKGYFVLEYFGYILACFMTLPSILFFLGLAC